MGEITESGNTPRIELYVRSLCPTGARQQQERVIERLASLEEAGRISGFSVTVWGKRIDVDAEHTRVGGHIRSRLKEFERWAREEDVSLRSFYRTQTVESGMLDDTDTITTITLPVMGLAEFTDGTVTHVAPCTDGDTVRRVTDRLAELASGEDAPPAETGRSPVESMKGEP